MGIAGGEDTVDYKLRHNASTVSKAFHLSAPFPPLLLWSHCDLPLSSSIACTKTTCSTFHESLSKTRLLGMIVHSGLSGRMLTTMVARPGWWFRQTR